MGNDGGSIPKRSELVKEAAKALTTAQLKEAQTEQQEYAWSMDPLTRKRLARPVVSDAAGVLYNKDSVIEYLLMEEGREKEEMGKIGRVTGDEAEGGVGLGCVGDRVKGLKDVVEVKFEIAEGEEEGEKGLGEKWVCSITGTVLGPGTKACYIVPCGHAFAGSVVREVKGGGCLTCNEPYAENDIITILPTVPTDIARLNLRIKTLREKGLTHALKKAPGSKKRKDKDEASKTSSEDKKAKKEASAPTTSNGNGIKNSATASLTKKVLDEQEARNKRRKLAQNDNVKSLFHEKESKPSMGNSADYMTRGFSIGKK
ncbi:hypothetical protein P153DRAFT_308023 [Dothidotthia symphoricarpi CBS 119687]|uniref:Uncharacterized protein n=1 Tax=Dothidotthia symphoricarpi CBS 119687 TaxID=1392245 RepID=A0A6A6AP67_9PLEO|nr:uncharacterized protein P153DRAFT_308023 [Dothidotthia symphoricarpi CBS 119687]KAF2133326.1 hypothetical protein P153DRAFT_308023 [Dothidotthia symphoricarpi CBS 119687]